MAGQTVKEILLKWNIDLSNVQTAISSLEDRMDRLFAKQQSQAAASQKTTQLAGASYKTNVVDPAIAASVKLQAQLAREQLSADAVRKARQGVIDLLRQESVLMAAKQDMSSQELAALKRVTSELEKQQRLMSKAAGGGGRGGEGGVNNYATSFLGGFGSRLAGTIGFSIISAEGLGRVFERLTDKMHELVLEGDKLVNIENLFDRLTQRAGADPSQYLEKLRAATHGLVTDTQLMTSANKVFMQNLPLTSNQVAGLTANVVNLARAQGNNATQALDSLNRGLVSGRMNMIAYQLGLSKNIQYELAETNQLPRNVALLTQYMIINRAVAEQLKVTGPPIDSLSAHFIAFEAAISNFFENVSLAMAKIPSSMTGLLDAISGFLNDVGNATAVAEAFSAALDGIATAARSVVDILRALKDALNPTYGGGGEGGFLEAHFGSFKGVLTLFAEGLRIVTSGLYLFVQVMVLSLKEFILFSTAFANFDLTHPIESFKAVGKAMADAIHDFSAQVVQDNAALVDQLSDMEDRLYGKDKDKKGPKAPPGQEEEDLRAQEKTAKLRKEVEVAQAQERLQQIKAGLEIEELVQDEAYKQGVTRLQDYLAKKMSLRREAAKAEIEVINKERDAELHDSDLATRITQKYYTEFKQALKDVQKQGKQKNQTQEQYDQQVQNAQHSVNLYKQALNDPALRDELINTRFNTKIDAVTEGVAKQQVEANRQRDADAIAAKRKRAQTELEIEKGSIDTRKTLLEQNFKEDVVTADAYLEKRKALVQEEYEAAIKAADAEYGAAVQDDASKASLEQKYAQASITREKEITAILDNEYQTRAKATQQYYDNLEESSKGQLEFEKELEGLRGPGASQSGQIPILQNLLNLELERLSAQRQQLSTMHELNDDWYKQYGAIQKTQLEVLKYEEALVKAHNNLSSLAENLKTLQTGFASFNIPGRAGTRFKDLAESLGEGAGRLEAFQKIRDQVISTQLAKSQGKAPVDWTDPHSVTRALGEATTGAADVFKDTLIPASQALAQAFHQLIGMLSSASFSKPSDDSTIGSQKPPHLAVGGSIKETGLAVVHAGEQVVPAAVTTALQNLAAVVNRVAASLAGLVTNATKLSKSDTSVRTQPTFSEQRAATLRPITPVAQSQSLLSSFATGGLVGAIKYLVNPPSSTVTGLSGPPTSANPIGSATDSDSFAAKMASRSSVGTSDSSDVQSQNTAAVIALTGATQAQTAALTGQTNALSTGTSTTGTGASASGESNTNQGLQQGVGIMTQGLQAVGGLMSALSGQGGPLKAGITGLASGAQLGTMIMPGIGTAIGAAAGLITGIFAGAAEAATEKIAHKMTDEFNAAVSSIKGGTQTLVGGIAQVQALMEATVSQLTGRKGGTQELNAVLPEMQQQLTALQQQQQQVLQNFRQQLQILNAPIQYGDSLNQIQQIINQYQQYIQAGGSVADANEYLQQSFSQLATQGIQQLNQDEQDAINNALNYNDLLLQRQNLIQSTNQQIQNIMSQGVAVQQMPEGVSKAQQIEQVSQNAQIQLDQMNEQISASDHELQNQQIIFGLATTRVGLENQLLALQDEQNDQQMMQVQALGNVVSSLNTALPTSMPAALQELGLGNAYVAPTSAEAPTPPVKTGIQSVDLSNEMAYQQALAYYNAQVNLPVGYINPAGAPASSTTIGTANQLYPGVPSTVPTTTSIPTTYGTGATGSLTQQQMLSLISGTQIGQPIGGAAPSYTAGSPGSGITGSPDLSGNAMTVGGAQIDTVSTMDGQALLVTVASGSALPSTTASPSTNYVLAGTYTAAGSAAPIQPVGPEPVQIPPRPTTPTTGATAPLAPTPIGYNLGVPTPLPSNINIPVTVVAGPGETQNVGVIGTIQSIANALTGLPSQAITAIAGQPVSSIPAPVTTPVMPTAPPSPTAPGQPTAPGLPPSQPTLPTPPPPIDLSSFTTLLNKTYTGENAVLNKGKSDFEAIIANYNSDQKGTLQQATAFYKNWMSIHSGARAMRLGAAMLQVINQLQADQTSSPAATSTSTAQPVSSPTAPVATLPTSPIASPVLAGTFFAASPAAGTPTATNTGNVLSGLLNGFGSTVGITSPSVAAPTATNATTSVGTQLSAAAQRASIETNINQLSNTRVSAETQLVSLKMQEISADMTRVQAWQDLLNTAQSSPAQSATLEAQMNATYNNRARMGLGGFYGEVANPT